MVPDDRSEVNASILDVETSASSVRTHFPEPYSKTRYCLSMSLFLVGYERKSIGPQTKWWVPLGVLPIYSLDRSILPRTLPGLLQKVRLFFLIWLLVLTFSISPSLSWLYIRISIDTGRSSFCPHLDKTSACSFSSVGSTGGCYAYWHLIPRAQGLLLRLPIWNR